MARLFAALGSVLRSTGQAIDSFGSSVQGGGYTEKRTVVVSKAIALCTVVPALTTMVFGDKKPILGKEVFVAPNAAVVGDVTIGDRASIWYGTVVRGDVHSVTIGERSSLQDNVVVHVAKNALPPGVPRPTIIGKDVTVGKHPFCVIHLTHTSGHGAVLHACTIADGCLVGMGATLLDGVQMASHSIVAAGALVVPNTIIETGCIWAGSPAKFQRRLTTEEIDFVVLSAEHYAELAAVHSEENSKTFDQLMFEKNNRRDRQMRSADYDSHLGILRDPKTREIKYMAPI